MSTIPASEVLAAKDLAFKNGFCKVVTAKKMLEIAYQHLSDAHRKADRIIDSVAVSLRAQMLTYKWHTIDGARLIAKDKVTGTYHGKNNCARVPENMEPVAWINASNGQYVNMLFVSQAYLDEFKNMVEEKGGNGGGGRRKAATYELENPDTVPAVLDGLYTGFTATGALEDIEAGKVQIVCILKTPDKDGKKQHTLPTKYQPYVVKDKDIEVAGVGVVRTYKVEVPKTAKEKYELSLQIKAHTAKLRAKKEDLASATKPFDDRIAKIRQQAEQDEAAVKAEMAKKSNVTTAQKNVQDVQEKLDKAIEDFRALA